MQIFNNKVKTRDLVPLKQPFGQTKGFHLLKFSSEKTSLCQFPLCLHFNLISQRHAIAYSFKTMNLIFSAVFTL